MKQTRSCLRKKTRIKKQTVARWSIIRQRGPVAFKRMRKVTLANFLATLFGNMWDQLLNHLLISSFPEVLEIGTICLKRRISPSWSQLHQMSAINNQLLWQRKFSWILDFCRFWSRYFVCYFGLFESDVALRCIWSDQTQTVCSFNCLFGFNNLFFCNHIIFRQSRYRVPVEPYFTVLATFGLVRLLEAIHGIRKQKWQIILTFEK